ncbi:ABC transporter [Desulfosporosinus fructosivorans]|uniref:ABC transporter n=1 Tax=Desulfosporosinus fructosivorans TaxID=2018669 RepID=A0A4Z0R7Z5_9FIRM|nr:ABC transporter permease subunit [Desulfosporosinus fructosivorans]TGE38535.1 ABC transporter [Desulfosporosinus fructosivorans]
MNIFIIEMKAHRKSLIIWCIAVLLMVGTGMSKYEVFSTTGQSINDVMSKLPKVVQAIFGIGAFDLSKASGFYALLFLYLVLMTTIHAAMLGANIISKEERDKTTEFLMVKPISRDKIITAKLSAAFVNIIILNIVTLISSFVIVGYFGKGESVTGDITLLMAGMFILQLMFMFIGTALAAVSKHPKTSPSMATGIILVAYLLSTAIDINLKLGNLRYLTPFKYFEAKNLIPSGGFEPVFVILSVSIIAVSLSATYVFYRKRDLNV